MVRRRINMEKQLFKEGETIYTTHDGEVIPFYVTATAIRTTQKGVKIRDYYCNCKKHNMPLPSHKGNNRRDRIRQNHNLFKTPEHIHKTPRVGDGQGGLVCCDPWGHKESVGHN